LNSRTISHVGRIGDSKLSNNKCSLENIIQSAAFFIQGKDDKMLYGLETAIKGLLYLSLGRFGLFDYFVLTLKLFFLDENNLIFY